MLVYLKSAAEQAILTRAIVTVDRGFLSDINPLANTQKLYELPV